MARRNPNINPRPRDQRPDPNAVPKRPNPTARPNPNLDPVTPPPRPPQLTPEEIRQIILELQGIPAPPPSAPYAVRPNAFPLDSPQMRQQAEQQRLMEAFAPIPWEGASEDGYREAIGYDQGNPDTGPDYTNNDLIREGWKFREGEMNPSYQWQLDRELAQRGLTLPPPAPTVGAHFSPEGLANPSEQGYHPLLFAPGGSRDDIRLMGMDEGIGNPWPSWTDREAERLAEQEKSWREAARRGDEDGYWLRNDEPGRAGGFDTNNRESIGNVGRKPLGSPLEFPDWITAIQSGKPDPRSSFRIPGPPARPFNQTHEGPFVNSPFVSGWMARPRPESDRDQGAGTREGRGPNMDYGTGPASDSEYGSGTRRTNRGMR